MSAEIKNFNLNLTENSSIISQINFEHSTVPFPKISQLVESIFEKIGGLTSEYLRSPTYLFANQEDTVMEKLLKVSSWIFGISLIIFLGIYIYDHLLNLYRQHFQKYSQMGKKPDEISENLEPPRVQPPKEQTFKVEYLSEHTTQKILEPSTDIEESQLPKEILGVVSNTLPQDIPNIETEDYPEEGRKHDTQVNLNLKNQQFAKSKNLSDEKAEIRSDGDSKDESTKTYERMSPIEQEILDPKIDSESNKGIIYAIENQKGCISHVIGTIHRPWTQLNLNKTKIPEIVKKSSAFFSENGDVVPVSTTKEPELLDTELTLIACKKNIPIHALDIFKEYSDAYKVAEEQISLRTQAETQKKINSKWNKFVERDEIKTLNKYESPGSSLSEDMIDAWKKGDSQLLQVILRIDSIASLSNPDPKYAITSYAGKQRNKNWLKKLLPKLENTEHPVSIVVGLAHLFGKAGLLKAFEDKGFKVRQI